MTRTEALSILSLGYLVFAVLAIRIGFFFHIPVNQITLGMTFLWYVTTIYLLIIFVRTQRIRYADSLISLGMFTVGCVLLYGLTIPFARTFDLSWDGQGYHQSAIIALTNGWNPVYDGEIRFRQRLPSQIFAEGYPSALWEIQAAVYAASHSLQAAKVLNIAGAVIAFLYVVALVRNLSVGRGSALVIALLVVLQPVFLIQFLTYMQDGFGYQLLVIACASLLLLIRKPVSLWPHVSFLFAELLLVSTKYSHLPVAAVLGAVFALVVWNRWLNKTYHFSWRTWLGAGIAGLVVCIFLYVPYVRNTLVYGYPFYPTNIPDLMGSVTYNNTPKNLEGKGKLSALFYGMFSRSQTAKAGDPTHPENVAVLKMPFTFSARELEDSAGLFNNRVGAAGPLYSGILVITVLFLVLAAMGAHTRHERYIIYSIYTIICIILFLSILAPTPNLFRYASQLQLLPFAVAVPLFAAYRRRYVPVLTAVILVLSAVNITLYGGAVIRNHAEGMRAVAAQYGQMRATGNTYAVRAQQFYSNYVTLEEQGIPYVITDRLPCSDAIALASTSNTTHYCVK